jgi:uncharacterized protein (DUF39 family)
VDYGIPEHPTLGKVNYAQLQSGEAQLNGKSIKTAPLSSILKAREIAAILKSWILRKDFLLSEPIQMFPKNSTVKPLRLM